MKPVAIVAFALLLLECSPFTISEVAQQGPSASHSAYSPEITLHSSSNLVLVDVIVLNAKTGLPDKTLRQDDFQIFDNGHPVAIKSFESGDFSSPL
jgi:hypothetical protein